MIATEMGPEPPTKEDVVEVFEHLDTDNSGMIDFSEFKNITKRCIRSHA